MSDFARQSLEEEQRRQAQWPTFADRFAPVVPSPADAYASARLPYMDQFRFNDNPDQTWRAYDKAKAEEDILSKVPSTDVKPIGPDWLYRTPGGQEGPTLAQQHETDKALASMFVPTSLPEAALMAATGGTGKALGKLGASVLGAGGIYGMTTDEAQAGKIPKLGGVVRGAGRPAAMGVENWPGIRAYHGSPSDFEKFDFAKAGTREGGGGTTFGRGLYFADDPKAAEIYRGHGGHAYEVNLKARPEDLLSWNDPVSGQARIMQNAAAQLPLPPPRSGMPFGPGAKFIEDAEGRWFLDAGGPKFPMSPSDMQRLFGTARDDASSLTGGQVYRRAATEMGDAAVSKQLRDMGIPGVRYPDEHRLSGQNYSIFDPGIIDIMRKYGLAGAAPLGAAAAGAAALSPDEAQAAKLPQLGGVVRGAGRPAAMGIENWPGLGGKIGGPWEGGIRAYHSSPHDFEKFDFSKIGTGEGAQVYGHGGYFAENPAVSGQGGQYWNQFKHRFAYNPAEMEAVSILQNHNFDRDKAIAELTDLKRYQPGYVEGATNSFDRARREAINAKNNEALELLKSGKPIGPRTYEVNINARPDLLLDWDKPLRAQEHIQETLLPALAKSENPHVKAYAKTWEQFPHHYTGENVYNAIASQGAPRMDPLNIVGIDKPLATQTLREAGIPGIRYLDEGSRQAAQQIPKHYSPKDVADYEAMNNITRNYVIFDPKLIEIARKYGIAPGMLGAGALGETVRQDRYNSGGT